MDLNLFLDPIDPATAQANSGAQSFYNNISAYIEVMPDYKQADIALIGLTDYRGTTSLEGLPEGQPEGVQGPNAIRQKLYALQKGMGRNRIVDLGNLKPGVDLQETYTRIQEVGYTLLEHDVLPVFFGGSHDLSYGQYMAYEELQKLVSLVHVDARLDLEEDAGAPPAQSHLQKVLLHDPNYLFHYSHLAHQSYLVNHEALGMLEKLYFETYRVGHVREHLKEMEPVIRQADMISFDMAAIRGADAPAAIGVQPFGLTGEEACQLSWYAGQADKLSSAGFYGFDPAHDTPYGQTAGVMATMIWYFIEGYYNRKETIRFTSNDYLRYVVSMPAKPSTVVFYKSKYGEKWWLEVPYPQEETRSPFGRNCIVPCSYKDYETANRGELPERWINTHNKLS